MADGTRVNELRKEVDSLKECATRTEKSIEELRAMTTAMATNLQATTVGSGQIPIDMDKSERDKSSNN